MEDNDYDQMMLYYNRDDDHEDDTHVNQIMPQQKTIDINDSYQGVEDMSKVKAGQFSIVKN